MKFSSTTFLSLLLEGFMPVYLLTTGANVSISAGARYSDSVSTARLFDKCGSSLPACGVGVRVLTSIAIIGGRPLTTWSFINTTASSVGRSCVSSGDTTLRSNSWKFNRACVLRASISPYRRMYASIGLIRFSNRRSLLVSRSCHFFNFIRSSRDTAQPDATRFMRP